MNDDDFGDFDDDGDEIGWEELDWDELGFKPEDGDRVRDAWQRVRRGYESRAELDGLMRFLDLLGEVAGDAVSPETRRQLERLLRDFLVVLRDALDRVIERLDRDAEEIEIEEIPID